MQKVNECLLRGRVNYVAIIAKSTSLPRVVVYISYKVEGALEPGVPLTTVSRLMAKQPRLEPFWVLAPLFSHTTEPLIHRTLNRASTIERIKIGCTYNEVE